MCKKIVGIVIFFLLVIFCPAGLTNESIDFEVEDKAEIKEEHFILAEDTNSKEQLPIKTKKRLVSRNGDYVRDRKMICNEDKTETFIGKASWYGPGFDGKVTANGEVFDEEALTAAHKELPFDTKVRVTNLDNGLTVLVRINDRGPYITGRNIDLSKGAAQKVDMLEKGVVSVKMEILEDAK
ncbi:MAG TPA: septal ring lytic transglycosylase RlpA family protein [Thermoanaerobacterales bacterium]|jgi:rare lipoprotein A (peptidoglycan hydrolase)|nr:septal ring lytic transglycosylase RlpA family protein [Thermoanaerobacterales bacterium]